LSVIGMLVGGMYLRFVTTRVHKDSHKPEGVFAAAYTLLDSGDLTRDEWKILREMLNWFNANLKSPPKKFHARRAIFWFKSNAEDNIRKIWALIHLLREHGHYIEVHKCRKLANILWEDKFQVAAFPSKHDGRITAQ
jgi:hypothetical protein